MLLLSLTTTSTELLLLLPLLLLSTAEKKKSTKRKVSHGHYECQEGSEEQREREGDACHTPFLLSVNFHAAPFVFISIKRTE